MRCVGQNFELSYFACNGYGDFERKDKTVHKRSRVVLCYELLLVFFEAMTAVCCLTSVVVR
jgi:hypothetical protein